MSDSRIDVDFLSQPRLTIDRLGRRHVSIPPRERLWRNLDNYGIPDVCWPWKRSTNPKGYGWIGVGKRVFLAHRIAYAAHYGVDPGDKLVCHTCDNPPCCNPAHMFLGTPKDNSVDMVAKGRSPHPRNERSGKAKLTNAAVEEIKARHAAGERQSVLAAEFGVHPAHLSRVVRGLRWVI